MSRNILTKQNIGCNNENFETNSLSTTLSSSHSTDNSEDNNDEQDEGTFIKIDILKNGYDWSKLLTTSYETEDTKLTVTADYLPSTGDIKEKYIVERCNFLKMELTNENKEMVKDYLESHQKALRNTLKEWIQQFWIEICPVLEITFNDGCKITKFEELQTAVRQCKSIGDAKKIAILLYISFDFCPNFRKKIAKLLMKQHGFRLEKKMMKRKKY